MERRKQIALRGPRGYAALAFIIAAVVFLFVEHGAHVFYVLPYLILLVCPLLHLFMHRGHGLHHRAAQPGEADKGVERS